MVVFNEIHNKHLQTSIGIVSILTEDKKIDWHSIWSFLLERVVEKIDWHSIWRFYENKKNTKIKNFKF